MNPFRMWFGTGLGHILQLGALDHLLFVSLLALAFPVKDWKRLLILITAFTLGHSFSLALSVMIGQILSPTYVEAGIAMSILATALYQLFISQRTQERKNTFLYTLTFCFGLLHGMGFSYQLISLLGKDISVFLPLLYFNLGIECGQLLVVILLLLFSLLLKTFFKLPYPYFKYTLICIIALFAAKMSFDRLLPLF